MISASAAMDGGVLRQASTPGTTRRTDRQAPIRAAPRGSRARARFETRLGAWSRAWVRARLGRRGFEESNRVHRALLSAERNVSLLLPTSPNELQTHIANPMVELESQPFLRNLR